MTMRIVTLALCLAACGTAPVAAQEMYKSIMPDGSVIYSDKPAEGAVKVDKATPDTSKAGVSGITENEAKTLKEMEDARKKRESAASRIDEAQRKLQAAETARITGKEPLPGDRLGTASGNQRLTDTYWERQKQLEQNVLDAQKELEAARAGK